MVLNYVTEGEFTGLVTAMVIRDKGKKIEDLLQSFATRGTEACLAHS